MGSSYEGSVMADSPYAFWLLDEGAGATVAADSSGNARPSGSSAKPMTFGLTDYLAAATNRTASIVGDVHQYVSWFPNSAISNTWTVEAWVRPAGTITLPAENTGGVTTLADGGTYRWVCYPAQAGSPDGGSGFAVGTNGIVAGTHAPGYAPAHAVYSGTVSSSALSQVVVVCNAKQFLIYLNGTLVRTGVTCDRTNVWIPCQVGNESTALGGADVSNVGCVSFYNSALSGTRILAHYNAMHLDARWRGSNSPMVMG